MIRMVVKSQIKLIKSLQQKKYRKQHSLFVMEGIKAVQELLHSDIIAEQVYSTDISLLENHKEKVQIISEKDLLQMSNLKSPPGVLGVFKIPEPRPIDFSGWTIALDGVSDPGNLGTIIRLCDWFGIKQLLCSRNTVDCYNPKVLQATMGSIARIAVHYDDLVQVFNLGKAPVYGTFMNAESIYTKNLPKAGILLLGNEANGISKEMEAFCIERIGIPQYGNSSTESLNVATATAICLSEIRREGITQK